MLLLLIKISKCLSTFIAILPLYYLNREYYFKVLKRLVLSFKYYIIILKYL
jgi:hypothetical protein